jgi:hypothetical protein
MRPLRGDRSTWEDVLQYVLCFLFYVSEAVTWVLRGRALTGSHVPTDARYELSTYRICSYVQCGVNVLCLVMQGVILCHSWAAAKLSTKPLQLVLTETPWLGMFACLLLKAQSDSSGDWWLQVGIDTCGYQFIILFWAVKFANDAVSLQRLFARVILMLCHVGFFVVVLVGNLRTEATETYADLRELYIASIFENILLFEILHIIIENVTGPLKTHCRRRRRRRAVVDARGGGEAASLLDPSISEQSSCGWRRLPHQALPNTSCRPTMRCIQRSRHRFRHRHRHLQQQVGCGPGDGAVSATRACTAVS